MKLWKMKNNLVTILLFLTACSADYSPKPRAYFHINLAEPDYYSFCEYSQFKFNISNQVIHKSLENSNRTEWFDLNYTQFNAHIYCSYFPINKNDFENLADESKKMAYFHTMKADGIRETEFNNPQQNAYGLVYEIKGNVATPLLFTLTDSTHSFFRGVLYFDNSPNQDSITPVLEYINKDIQVLMESFQWKQ